MLHHRLSKHTDFCSSMIMFCAQSEVHEKTVYQDFRVRLKDFKCPDLKPTSQFWANLKYWLHTRPPHATSVRTRINLNILSHATKSYSYDNNVGQNVKCLKSTSGCNDQVPTNFWPHHARIVSRIVKMYSRSVFSS